MSTGTLARTRVFLPDPGLALVALVLAFSGLVVSGSARAYTEAVHAGGSPVGLVKGAVHLLVGLGVMFVCLRFDYRKLTRRGVLWILIAAASGLLIAALFGSEVHNTHRWLRIFGVSVQPSELAKPVLVLAVAAALARTGPLLATRQGFVRPLVVGGWLAGLVLVGKDLGTPTLLMLVTLLMTVAAGACWKHTALLSGAAAVLFGAFAWLVPYRRARLTDFVAGIDFSPAALGDLSYQLKQSILAVGSGGLWGRGLGGSTQKAFFLPEADDDFVFAIVCEELGMIGALCVIAAFLLLAFYGARAAERAPDELGRLIALGATWMLCGQALIHMLVVVGLLPTKGLPLPFLSSGGTSVLASCALVGLMLNVSLRGRQSAR